MEFHNWFLIFGLVLFVISSVCMIFVPWLAQVTIAVQDYFAVKEHKEKYPSAAKGLNHPDNIIICPNCKKTCTTRELNDTWDWGGPHCPHCGATGAGMLASVLDQETGGSFGPVKR